MLESLTESLGTGGTFHAHQLLTHAFLHDYGSIRGFILHLAGNLLFMLVFGSRVNALLGNVATAVIYPILAVGAAAVYLWLGDPSGPMLGASGAINGLAGMYLVLFPVHRVYCGMWFRFRFWVAMKIFAVRGFWVLLIYFAYDALMVALKVSSGTAHWAHLGGFLIGVLIALGLLVSRQFNCGGGDLLSVALGRRAWGLIGRPGRWNRPMTA
jgi:membrane associated rhomboid family serine protease